MVSKKFFVKVFAKFQNLKFADFEISLSQPFIFMENKNVVLSLISIIQFLGK